MKSLVFWTFSCDIGQRELKFAADWSSATGSAVVTTGAASLTRASYQRR
jgi:hypothetical protein